MLILEPLTKLLCLGYDKHTLQKHMADLDNSNLIMLINTCLVGGITFVFCAVVFLFFDNSTSKVVSFIIGALCLLVIYIMAKSIVRTQLSRSSRTINALISLLIICCCLQAIYIGTFKSGNDLAVAAIFMFLLSQIIFDRLPIQNIMVVVPCGMLFIICSYLTKPSSVQSAYDTLHTLISISLGLVISWNKSRLKVDSIITTLKLRQANYILYHTSTTDFLTGLSNRRKTFEKATFLQKQCQNDENSVLCLVVMDIDNFKAYNDFYGHPLGDKLLEKVGNALNQYAIDNRLDIGRIGGEEFMCFWQNRCGKNQETVAEELRIAIERLNISHEKSKTSPTVTISIGAFCATQSDNFEIVEAYELADQALYKAKEHGKNCCWKYSVQTKSFAPIDKAC